MPRKTLYIILISLLCLNADAQQISNIRFEQEGKMINIYYDLSGEGTYEVKVYCSQDGGITWDNPLLEVSGAVGIGQQVGINKKIIWDVLSEREKLGGEIKFKIVALSCGFSGNSGTFIDTRDGKTYRWVEIGDQVWMAENLDFKTDSGSWCYYNQTPNCSIYGRLYDWNTARRVCPNGWHLPFYQECVTLIQYINQAYSSDAGGAMKESGTSHWMIPYPGYIGSTNSSGFTALPGGGRSTDGGFYDLRYASYFWSAAESWQYSITNRDKFIYWEDSDETYGFSVRCVKD